MYICFLFTVKPSIDTHPQSVNIKEGENLTLFCNATGSPVLEISWTFNGSVINTNENSRITLSSGSQELTITSVSRGDSGEYRCAVKNRVGSDTSNDSTVNVQCKYRAN